jgi:hypothetical protein
VEDVHGNSGTGIVALGVVFPSGKCVFSWRTEKTTITVTDSITVVEDLHSHNGRTEVEFFEPTPSMKKKLDAFMAGEEIEKKDEKKKKK